MKAFVYKTTKNNKNYICTKFDNSNEHVTIFHNDYGIYQQYWDIGEVYYEVKNSDIKNNIPEEAIKTINEVGTVVKHVWRPGLCLNISEALEINKGERDRAKKELKILIEKLHELLMYIEPDPLCLRAYGHKIRELLILACTECENYWTTYIRLSGNKKQRLTTNEFVKLKDLLYLDEYKVIFSSHPVKIDLYPFKNWSVLKPTETLSWYDGYNKTKHNRENNFQHANLENCLNAIAANIVMYCVRYSPYDLIDSKDICSNLINEYFSIELVNPNISSFYVPFLKSVQIASGAFSSPLGSNFEKDWEIKPFIM